VATPASTHAGMNGHAELLGGMDAQQKLALLQALQEQMAPP